LEPIEPKEPNADNSAPTPEQIPAPMQPPAPRGLEEWVAKNIAPLKVIFFALLMETVNSALVGLHTAPSAPPPPPPSFPSAAPETWQLFSNPFFWAGLMAWACALVICLFSSRAKKEELRDLLFRCPWRPTPELGGLDLVAALASYIAIAGFLGILADLHPLADESAQVAILLLLNGAALAVAIMAAVLLSRLRRGSKSGSAGLWPFWKQEVSGAQSIWHDIGVGLMSYPLTIWLVAVAIVFNQELLDYFGKKGEENPLIGQVLGHPRLWVLVIYFLMATVGAAIFEELIFRGMIYNVLRRRLGVKPAACAAALLFALAHLHGQQNAGNLLGLFVLALVLTWLYEHTGRLVASMTFHAFNNLLALVVVLGSSQT